jgi:hypothetical protein
VLEDELPGELDRASLKYCPNEKFPSISKKVRCEPSRPDVVDVRCAETLLHLS